MAELTYNTKRWFAYYVKPRHEKKVAERLKDKGFEVFCPLVCIQVRWSDRWKKIHKPLISGYVFVRATETERREILNEPAIWHTVFWNGRAAIIRDEEIEVMRLLLNEGENVRMESFRPGDRVKVTDGGYELGLTGMEGVVVKVKGNQVSIRIESLQAQLSVTVPGRILTGFEASN